MTRLVPATIKVYIKDRVYVPEDAVDPEHIRHTYTKQFFKESACRTCPYLQDRPAPECDSCQAAGETITLVSSKLIKGVPHIGMPVGDKRNFEKVTGLAFSECKFVDWRVTPELDSRIKFTAKLRDYQTPLVRKLVKKGYGLLQAPPRTGKTITLLKIMLELGYKFIILADQHEFLTQFMDHVYGNPKEGIPKCTNIPELEKKLGYKLCGIPKTEQDFKRFQIFVMPYQQFISKNGMRRFKKLAPYIGSVGIDECFTRGHLVQTENGLKDLADLVAQGSSDLVLSRNLVTGADEYQPIISTTKKMVTQLCRVTINGVPHTCTPTHLFWSEDRKDYVEAQHLNPRERICATKSRLE